MRGRERTTRLCSLLRRELGAKAAERLERELISLVHIRDHAVGVEDADDRLVRPVAGGRVLRKGTRICSMGRQGEKYRRKNQVDGR